jgi:hypothetical protein
MEAIGSERQAASPGAIDMRTFLKMVVWSAAAFVGLFLWNVTPDFRPLITWLIAGSLVCYLVCIVVGLTVKQAMSAEQLKLHSRLEILDRKVTALLKVRLSNAGFDNPALPVVLIPIWRW